MLSSCELTLRLKVNICKMRAFEMVCMHVEQKTKFKYQASLIHASLQLHVYVMTSPSVRTLYVLILSID